MIVVNENEYMFLDGSIIEPSTWQENGTYFFEVKKVPDSYYNSDVETGLLQEQAQEWAVETALTHFNLKQEDYFVSVYPWEERVSIALIPLTLVPGYVKSDPANYWYDFNRECWTKIN